MSKLMRATLFGAALACGGPAQVASTSPTSPAATAAQPSNGSGGEATNAVLRLPSAPPPLLSGSRCRDAGCTCRRPGQDDAEATPPDPSQKRLEIRMSSGGGQAVLASPTLGRFEMSGPGERCFYSDVIPGTRHDLVFLATEAANGQGLAPVLTINEYGPVGPWWYGILNVACEGGVGGQCDRDAAESWIKAQRAQKRGRVEPCGSLVVSRLHWQSSGGQADRDGGRFRDFGVSFSLDVKRFATQFAPGATECVPK